MLPMMPLAGWATKTHCASLGLHSARQSLSTFNKQHNPESKHRVKTQSEDSIKSTKTFFPVFKPGLQKLHSFPVGPLLLYIQISPSSPMKWQLPKISAAKHLFRFLQVGLLYRVSRLTGYPHCDKPHTGPGPLPTLPSSQESALPYKESLLDG